MPASRSALTASPGPGGCAGCATPGGASGRRRRRYHRVQHLVVDDGFHHVFRHLHRRWADGDWFGHAIDGRPYESEVAGQALVLHGQELIVDHVLLGLLMIVEPQHRQADQIGVERTGGELITGYTINSLFNVYSQPHFIGMTDMLQETRLMPTANRYFRWTNGSIAEKSLFQGEPLRGPIHH